jgi:hypothetical protein
MNTVMRTLGGAIGGQIVATLIADNVAHGLPTVTGFTESFALQAVFLVIAMLAGTLVPMLSEHRATTPVGEQRELVRAQELG